MTGLFTEPRDVGSRLLNDVMPVYVRPCGRLELLEASETRAGGNLRRAHRIRKPSTPFVGGGGRNITMRPCPRALALLGRPLVTILTGALLACGAPDPRVDAPTGSEESTANAPAPALVSASAKQAPAAASPWTINRVSLEERALVRQLAVEAIGLEQQARHAEALELLQRAEQIGTAPTLRLHLARCLARLGRMDEAVTAYRSIVDAPNEADAPAAFRDARVSAEAELQKLGP